MPNRVFVIGDTHFNHSNIIKETYEKQARPFATIAEHDAELVYRWNHVVKKHDTVWHLGDVLFGEGGWEHLAQLNGLKHLIMGNHDYHDSHKYLKHFSRLYGSAKLRGALLTHAPLHTNQLSRFPINIHGHLHSRSVGDPRYICVSAEQTQLAPILLDTVLNRFKDENSNNCA